MIRRFLQIFHVFLFLAILMAISPAAAQKPPKKVLEGSKVESLPPPQRGHGHATGIILNKGQAKPGLPIFLLLWSDTGGTVPDTPAAKTDENGNWVILNLKPGKYAVMCKVPSGNFSLSETFFHKVKAGKVTDFGRKDCNDIWAILSMQQDLAKRKNSFQG